MKRKKNLLLLPKLVVSFFNPRSKADGALERWWSDPPTQRQSTEFYPQLESRVHEFMSENPLLPPISNLQSPMPLTLSNTNLPTSRYLLFT